MSDSDRHAVVAFDLDRAGAARNQRDAIKNVAGVPGVSGRIWMAAFMWPRRGLPCIRPQGKLERTLLESENTTNCAFGEGDLESLFIAASGSIYRVKLGVKGALQY